MEAVTEHLIGAACFAAGVMGFSLGVIGVVRTYIMEANRGIEAAAAVVSYRWQCMFLGVGIGFLSLALWLH